MRIALIADPDSPHTRAWVDAFAAAGDRVELFSPYKQVPALDLPATITVPLARARPRRAAPGAGRDIRAGARDRAPAAPPRDPRKLRALTRALRLVPAVRGWLRDVRPDRLIALRFQPEGYLASAGGFRPYALVSWGQDVLRFARAHPLHLLWSAHAARRAALLLGETDAVVAALRGLGGRPDRCQHGLTGIDVEHWSAARHEADPLAPLRACAAPNAPWLAALEEGAPLILSPRAVAPNGHQRQLVRAVGRGNEAARDAGGLPPLLLQVGPGDAGERALCQDLARQLGLTARYYDLGRVPRAALRSLYVRATVVCSLWAPDGLSQTLLECMAAGALPLVADLPGNREWIEPGVNGLLADPTQPEQLAAALARAQQDGALRDRARAENPARVRARATRHEQMARLVAMIHALEAKR